MRAAVLHEVGGLPRVEDRPEPSPGEGEALVEVSAAPLNPIDISIGSGRFYGGTPETPYVPGREAVGRVLRSPRLAEGTRVYFGGGGGALAERAVADENTLVEVPSDQVDDAHAACFGIAGLAGWLPLWSRAELREGETVLVLGASGAVGQVAVQAAKLVGAGRVVAAARDPEGLERARRLGADATVNLADFEGDELVEAIEVAAVGEVDVTVDPLWGEPAVAALRASAAGARLVQVGQSAAPEATVASADVRGKGLEILGHTNFGVPAEERAAAYRRMVEHAARGELRLEHEVMPLDRVAEAWERQAASPGRKLVLTP